ncbi:nicotinic acid mononucleotide adenylyltransferase [Protofrankia sp. BMG5.30]|nr:nicotinic acid mononucleotide adenylyltransferase [Protofrankia sp. BMG5.30]
MGGTFDPVHNGHLVAASEVAALFDLDEVVFVPSGQPWQKADREVSPAEARYLMTFLATAGNPRFTVSRIDVDRSGPTYTIDTLRDLRRQRSDATLFFITGADALAQILSWRDVQELFGLAHFVGVTRPGYQLELDASLPVDAVSLLEVPALAISSSDIRARVSRGAPIWYLTPDGVVRFIAKSGLYQPRGQAAPTGLVVPTGPAGSPGLVRPAGPAGPRAGAAGTGSGGDTGGSGAGGAAPAGTGPIRPAGPLSRRRADPGS